MNNIKTLPAGIDEPIQSMQTYLYNKLSAKWGTSSSSYQQFGRAYRNQTADGFTPEVFTSITDYREVYFDDTLAALSFFGVDDVTPYKAGDSTAKVFVVFMVNLNRIKPTFTTRADEEARADVESLLFYIKYGFTMTGYVQGIEEVFKEYSGWKKASGVKYRDMQGFHCFRINFSLLYQPQVNPAC